ncbi:MAG: RIP metalloprotease RseP [Gemmatimonadetes bacterium]|nr:RIP metalloprotease RseP [Gemmatimonadota bacterium]NIO30739.1 RIP metalloprotease RseP [Gemmatimonadota bacterium]
MNSIIAFIIVLGVLIVIHELGHFITAKLAGIAVPRFSIGLGPRVWGFTIGETEYVVSALPLGGYVKMAGMGEDEALEALEGGKSDLEVPRERRFESKSVATRSVVISAGVVMNFVFAIFAYAGIAYYQSWVPLIGSVVEGSPAEEAGLQAGDLVTAVDGQKVDMWMEFRNHVNRRPGEEVTLGVLRDDQEIELLSRIERAAVFDSVSGDSVFYGQIGVYHDTINAGRALGLGGSLVAGTGRTFELTWLILRFVGRLITGAESARDIGGPILIGQLSGQAARAGVLYFVAFMAFLSVNLAVLNLLPIPILDGGHLVFLAIEAVRGRALSLQTRARLSQVGFLLILAIMVWAITSDVLRAVGN